MQRDATITIRVTSDAKEEWKDYAEEDGNARSLTQFIELAVQQRKQQLDGDTVVQSNQQQTVEVANELPSEVKQALSDIKAKVGQIESRTQTIDDNIKREIQSEKQREEKGVLYYALPTVEPHSDEWDEGYQMAVQSEKSLTIEAPSGEPEDIANKVQTTGFVVEDELERLYEQYGDVHRKTMRDGKRVYWRD